MRWSLLPAAQPVPISQEDLAKLGPDFLEQEITERVDQQVDDATEYAEQAPDPTADELTKFVYKQEPRA